MKTTKETMKILNVGSRTTLQKICDAMRVTPTKDEYGWNCYSEDDIKLLKEYKPTCKPPIILEETPEDNFNKLHDALDYLREHNTRAILEFTPNYRFDVTNKTRKQRELLYNLYEEYQEAQYNKRKQILNTLDNKF